MKTKKYKMSWDKKVIIITIISILIIIGTLIFITYFSIKNGEGNFLLIFIFLFNIAILVITYSFAPKKIIVDENNIKIIRSIGEIVIPRDTICSYRKLAKEEMTGTIRRAASDGLFGYWGKFSNSKIGNFNMYATKMDNLVLIKSKDEKQIVLSPDNLTEFLKDMVSIPVK